MLRGVSFDVAPGEFCAVLGASGAGKTTLLRAANGLVALTSGTVEIDGDCVTAANLRVIRRKVAMVHQHFALVDRLTVAQNILSGIAPAMPFWRVALQHYPPDLRDKACRLIAEVGLEQRQVNMLARELSGGQQQRVGIARALIGDPQLILADEPVASLDPKVARDIIALLRRASRQHGAAVLCSLHQVHLARAFADRIVALKGGAIVFDGPPAQLGAAEEDAIYADERALAPGEV